MSYRKPHKYLLMGILHPLVMSIIHNEREKFMLLFRLKFHTAGALKTRPQAKVTRLVTLV